MDPTNQSVGKLLGRVINPVIKHSRPAGVEGHNHQIAIMTYQNSPMQHSLDWQTCRRQSVYSRSGVGTSVATYSTPCAKERPLPPRASPSIPQLHDAPLPLAAQILFLLNFQPHWVFTFFLLYLFQYLKFANQFANNALSRFALLLIETEFAVCPVSLAAQI